MDKITYFKEDKDKPSKINIADNLLVKFSKYLNSKNIKIVLLVIVGFVAVFVLFGVSKNENSVTNDNVITTSGYISTMDYCEMLESKLCQVLSSIDGVGKVSVMISVDGSPELIYANEEDKTESSNPSGTQSSSFNSSPIIIETNGSSSALVMTEKLPAVKGVIVVSSGAGNVAIKLNLLNAVSTLLDISTDQVTVLKGV